MAHKEAQGYIPLSHQPHPYVLPFDTSREVEEYSDIDLELLAKKMASEDGGNLVKQIAASHRNMSHAKFQILLDYLQKEIRLKFLRGQ